MRIINIFGDAYSQYTLNTILLLNFYLESSQRGNSIGKPDFINKLLAGFLK